MTSSGGSKPPSPLPFRGDPHSPEHVLERIKTLTAELEALQAEIQGQIAAPAELLDRHSLLEQAGAAGVLVDFKVALDQLRSILWFCESGDAASAGGDVRVVRERELARATELLKALSPPGFAPSSKTESGSFFERLDRVIDNYMQESSSTRSAGKRPKA
jgi:hypothetical protein